VRNYLPLRYAIFLTSSFEKVCAYVETDVRDRSVAGLAYNKPLFSLRGHRQIEAKAEELILKIDVILILQYANNGSPS
jgi:hypothetical protein